MVVLLSYTIVKTAPYSKEYEFYSAVVGELTQPGIMECQHTDSNTDYGGSTLRLPQQASTTASLSYYERYHSKPK